MSDETKKTGHTPGPWQWHWQMNVNENEADCGVTSDRGHSICRAPRYEHKTQWEANARLIAAAPDLLAACQSTVWLLEMMVGIGRFPGNADALLECKAAIAKAEGR